MHLLSSSEAPTTNQTTRLWCFGGRTRTGSQNFPEPFRRPSNGTFFVFPPPRHFTPHQNLSSSSVPPRVRESDGRAKRSPLPKEQGRERQGSGG